MVACLLASCTRERDTTSGDTLCACVSNTKLVLGRRRRLLSRRVKLAVAAANARRFTTTHQADPADQVIDHHRVVIYAR